jgi:hypothetical protein
LSKFVIIRLLGQFCLDKNWNVLLWFLAWLQGEILYLPWCHCRHLCHTLAKFLRVSLQNYWWLWHITHLFESIIWGHCPRPVTLLHGFWQNYCPFWCKNILHDPGSVLLLRIVKHTVLLTALFLFLTINVLCRKCFKIMLFYNVA